MAISTIHSPREGTPSRSLPSVRPLWLESDEALVALVAAGNTAAFETLDGRYRPRLLAFCRHIVRSESDAEDLLQETFAAAFNAMRTDQRPLHVRPWLYRIARNRCLNHIREVSSARANGNVKEPTADEERLALSADGGSSTADLVIRREGFRLLVEDMFGLAEAQRTALVLHEMHGLPYHDVAEAMDTSVASVKSLLVRARVSLARAADARELPCDHAQRELGEAAQGLRRSSARVRWHLKRCGGCWEFKDRMKEAGRRVVGIAPVGPIAALKGLLVAKLGPSAATGAVSGAGATATADSVAIATKAAVGLATLAALTTGVAGIERATRDHPSAAEQTRRAPAVSLGPPATRRERASVSEAPSSPPARERPPAPPLPAGEIESSTPDVVQGVTPTGRPTKTKSPEPSPGTSTRGRPAPGTTPERRTRPAPDSPPSQTSPEPLPPPGYTPEIEPPPNVESPVASQPSPGAEPEPPPPRV